MEDLKNVVAQEQAELLRLVQETFERILAASGPGETTVAEPTLPGQGPHGGEPQLGCMMKPRQPTLVEECLDPLPPPAQVLEISFLTQPMQTEQSDEVEDPTGSRNRLMENTTSKSGLIGGGAKKVGKLSSTEKIIKDEPTVEYAGARGRLFKLLPYVDYLAAALVMLNSAVMMVELELEGRALGSQLGLGESMSFEVISCELLLRLAVIRCNFFMDVANWFDIVLVILGLLEITVMQGDVNNILMMRLLVKACYCFLPSLGWSMTLLAVFMSIGTLVLGNLLQDFISDTNANLEDRVWIWQRYGTAYHAMYTLFEVTFAGNWPTNARPVLQRVSQTFVIFFVLYISIIVFALIRVITAIFLKDTLDAAQADAENLVVDRLRKKAEYVNKLQAAFNAIDNSGNGMISEEQLTAIFNNPKVEAYFQTLDVDVTEGHALFHMIDNGDGQVTLDEFIDGILRCRGPARALDQVAMRADLKNLDSKLSQLVESVTGTKVPRKSTVNFAHNFRSMEAASTAHQHVF
ncbi:Two pore calcium channel protein 1B [Symbiodinium microadriaticum]|uniref:Two pore calcium channel protein 1B n=1 Tax=Symbiodinium microadriaticum TaxID=2951 RepID=A0A1Q9DWJ7_SYMMI|nr:Two pore calcium channel protein 1B [Symbiodinium microadriaticum]